MRTPLPAGDRRVLGAATEQSDLSAFTTSARAACRTRFRRCSTIPDVGGAHRPARDSVSDDPQLSPMQIWCNEAQERYVLGVRPDAVASFEAMCARERCPFAVVGTARAERQTWSNSRDADSTHPPIRDRVVIDLPMDVLFGKPPQMHRDTQRMSTSAWISCPTSTASCSMTAIKRVLRLPGGRQQDVPGHDRRSHGRRTVLARSDGRSVAGSGRRLRGDARAISTVMPAKRWRSASARRLRCSMRRRRRAWRSAKRSRISPRPTSTTRRRQAFRELDGRGRSSRRRRRAVRRGARGRHGTVSALGHLAFRSARIRCRCRRAWQQTARQHKTIAPVSLIVIGVRARARCAPRADAAARASISGEAELWLIDLGAGRNRLGGSTLAQVYDRSGGLPPDLDDAALLARFFAAIQAANAKDLLLAYHDRSDGGVFVDADRNGVRRPLRPRHRPRRLGRKRCAALFNEELGAVRAGPQSRSRRDRSSLLDTHGPRRTARSSGRRAATRASACALVARPANRCATLAWTDLMRAWSRNEPCDATAARQSGMRRQETNGAATTTIRGITPRAYVRSADDVAAPYIATRRAAARRDPARSGRQRPGRNGRRVHARRLRCDRRAHDRSANRPHALDDFAGFAACGGFSLWRRARRRTRLGRHRSCSTRGCASSSRHSSRDTAKFALGVCNGCQMMAACTTHSGRRALAAFRAQPIRAVRSAAGHAANRSNRRRFSFAAWPDRGFRSRSRTARAAPHSTMPGDCRRRSARTLRFVDIAVRRPKRYPLNPNGSPRGIAGFTAADGRVDRC